MKSTFIIILFLLVLPRNALFCEGFRGFCSLLWNYRLWQIRAELSKLLLPVSSKIGSKREILTTKDFYKNKSTHISVDALTPNAWLLALIASFTVLLLYTIEIKMQYVQRKFYNFIHTDNFFRPILDIAFSAILFLPLKVILK